ncbi:effector binding domain-containing protein [Flavobacterium psychroterrae]|uniref:Effector binding domain-containing protein n=1 Tax=Flavobacterium psychroterrae TaxID=2133767 RepID=A0ABS5PF74_9FLAO|nr:effector binding domain-containing protein [Flavobacterium psychroterrae]MBS7232916.1 effector binding domain-containing protein [Flavobacterium psychroterrae]
MIIEKFSVIGISVRTTNENGKSGEDIPALWNKFMMEEIQNKIPNKVSSDLFCIYTDYEKDHTQPYTTILGCKVKSLDVIPENMTGKTIETANYELLIAKGNLNEGIVYNKWLEIWNSDLDRSFTADFEVYGETTQNPNDAEVDIFIAVQ